MIDMIFVIGIGIFFIIVILLVSKNSPRKDWKSLPISYNDYILMCKDLNCKNLDCKFTTREVKDWKKGRYNREKKVYDSFHKVWRVQTKEEALQTKRAIESYDAPCRCPNCNEIMDCEEEKCQLCGYVLKVEPCQLEVNGECQLAINDSSYGNGQCYDTCDKYVSITEKDKMSRTISQHVRREVWRRDMGRCVKCGSQERLEYDHIIPFSKGGSNTVRNIELLCESCNRKKSNKI